MATLNNAPFMLRGTCLPSKGKSFPAIIPALENPSVISHWSGWHYLPETDGTECFYGQQLRQYASQFNIESVIQQQGGDVLFSTSIRTLYLNDREDVSNRPYTFEALQKTNEFTEKICRLQTSSGSTTFALNMDGTLDGFAPTVPALSVGRFYHVVIELHSTDSKLFINGELAAELGELPQTRFWYPNNWGSEFAYARVLSGAGHIATTFAEAQLWLDKFGESF